MVAPDLRGRRQSFFASGKVYVRRKICAAITSCRLAVIDRPE
jgi:hypothetical protein